MSQKTIGDLAREALAVQDASNLSGVVHSFARAISDLRDLVPGGSDALHTHPICQLWADKVAHLTRTQGHHDTWELRAYREVHALAEA